MMVFNGPRRFPVRLRSPENKTWDAYRFIQIYIRDFHVKSSFFPRISRRWWVRSKPSLSHHRESLISILISSLRLHSNKFQNDSWLFLAFEETVKPRSSFCNRYGHVCSISRLIDGEKINSHDDEFTLFSIRAKECEMRAEFWSWG